MCGTVSVCYLITSTGYNGHEHTCAQVSPRAGPAQRCGVVVGIARDADGMWMRFLCEACHGLANSSYSSESCGSGGLHALGLAGKCAKCRTKASYGAPLSPPQRCLRHKEARDIARSLGSSCVVDGCKKARLFGSRGGVPLCARCICSESCWNSLSRFTSGSMLLPIRMTSNTSGSCNSIRGETRVRTRCEVKT